MNKRLLPLILALCAVSSAALLAQAPTSAPAPAAAPGGPGGPGGRGRGGPPELDTELNKIMHTIEDNMRALRNPIKDMTKNAESLVTVGKIRDAFVAAAKEKPDFLKAQPEDKKAQFLKDYDEQMKKALASVDKLVAALKANNPDDIAKYYKEVADYEDPSHKEFQAPKPPRAPRGGQGGPGGPGGMGAGGMGGMGQGGMGGGQAPAPQGAPAAK